MAQQNVHFGDGNNNVQFVYGNNIADVPLFSGTISGFDLTGNIISHGTPNPPSNPVNSSEGRDESSSSTSEVNFRNRKNSGGRPKKVLTLEELQNCKGYTIVNAATKLEVGKSTLQRHLEEVTGYKTWPEFQQSMTDSQSVHGKERMQDKDKVPINVEHKGKLIPFNLPSPAIWEALQKHIKKSLKLKDGTYDIKYFDGERDLYIICNDSLKSCLGRAAGTLIELKVVEHTKRG